MQVRPPAPAVGAARTLTASLRRVSADLRDCDLQRSPGALDLVTYSCPEADEAVSQPARRLFRDGRMGEPLQAGRGAVTAVGPSTLLPARHLVPTKYASGFVLVPFDGRQAIRLA